MQTLNTVYNRENNIFLILRNVAALAVVYFHYIRLYNPFLTKFYVFGFFSPAHLGVFMFFGLSGFLVTQSLIHSSSNKSYLIKRTARIYPLIALYLIFIPLLLQSHPAKIALPFQNAYASQHGPLTFAIMALLWPALLISFYFLLRKILKVFAFICLILGMLLMLCPFYKYTASIWTLLPEVIAYVLLLITYIKISKNNLQLFTIISTIIIISAYYVSININNGFSNFLKSYTVQVIGMNGYGPFILIGNFFVGSLMYLYKEKIPASKTLMSLSATLILIIIIYSMLYVHSMRDLDNLTSRGNQDNILFVIVSNIMVYLSISFGAWIKNIREPKNDITYGTYLFHESFAKIPMALGIAKVPSLLIGLLMTPIFAWHSYKYIESRIMHKAKKIK